jgi:hypothetical protein
MYDDSSNNSSSEDNSIIIAGSLEESGSSEYNSYSDDDDDDSDDDSDSDDGIEYDSIHNEDSYHFYNDKEDGKYYIGLCHPYSLYNTIHWLFSTSVSARCFLQNDYDNINNYLYYYGLVRIPNHEVDIMQVQRQPDETCTVIIKTHWLRLVQRHWKRTYALRRNIIRQRISPQMLHYNQVHGNYPPSLSRIPSLTGMLSVYGNTT